REVTSALKWILSLCKPLRIILIGSALGCDFDDCSDLDFVLLFDTKMDARDARKRLYTSMRPIQRSIECICVDMETFKQAAEIGGIFWVAKQEGKLLYDFRAKS
ncbi:MAG: hypothetical protein HY537_02100, partial [Deltaproteobacteria bacterium]|nr:hypothetical protein [Deltaproteobacteria bacterium]